MVLVEAGVEQPVAVWVAGQEVHGAAGSTAPQRRMPLREVDRRDRSGQRRCCRGRKRKAHRLRAQPGNRGAPSNPPTACRGGQGTPRASRLRGAGPRLKREGRLGLGAGPDLRGGVVSLERGAKGGNHLTGYPSRAPQTSGAGRTQTLILTQARPPRKSCKLRKEIFLFLIDKRISISV